MMEDTVYIRVTTPEGTLIKATPCYGVESARVTYAMHKLAAETLGLRIEATSRGKPVKLDLLDD